MEKQLEAWSIFRKTLTKAQRNADEELRRHGITVSQFNILWSLSLEESTPMSELSRKADCVNSNITSIITRMEDKNLVKRVADKKDRRIVRVELTEEGKAIYNNTVAPHKEFIVNILSCYDEEELDMFYKLLNKLYDHAG